MVKIAVVEDSPVYLDKLMDYLGRYKEEYRTEIKAVPFSDGALFLVDYRAEYDIILMDIEMPLTDGMTTAEEIRKVDTEVVIIFITNSPHYAIRGYAVEALDYVLKPVNYFAFSQCLNRALARMKNRAAKYITITVNRNIMKLNAADIHYIESKGHTLIFHAADGDFKTQGTLRETEKQLEGHGFSRGNNFYLINLRYVDGVQDGCAIVAGEKLLLSRPRKNAFMESLAKYVGGVLK